MISQAVGVLLIEAIPLLPRLEYHYYLDWNTTASLLIKIKTRSILPKSYEDYTLRATTICSN